MLTTLFVDDDAAPDGDGSAWASAYSNLNIALGVARIRNSDAALDNDVDSIWIADGTYFPEVAEGEVDARRATFNAVDGVTLYGGFLGVESSLAERDWSANETILSGDIGTQSDVVDNVYSVISVGVDAETAIDGVTVKGGYANGDAIDSASADKRGGGVFVEGTLSIRNSSIRENYAFFGGSGVYNAGNLTISNSNIVENDQARISNTGTINRGGGVYSYTDGQTVIENSTISENYADEGGGIYGRTGGLFITDSRILNNTTNVGSGSWGGGLYLRTDVTILRSQIAGNTANLGAGIMADDQVSVVTVLDSTISGNEAASAAGAIHFGTAAGRLNVVNTTISGNIANRGAGLHVTGGEVLLTHATVVQNVAQEKGGGVAIEGGFYSVSAVVNNSIVATNSATEGADFFVQDASLVGQSNLIGDGSGQDAFTHDADGNFVGTTSAPIDPLLGVLKLNGGATKTHVPAPGSFAIDNGTASLSVNQDGAVLEYDQRSPAARRLVGNRVDIGAAEAGSLFPVDQAFAVASVWPGILAATSSELRIVFNAEVAPQWLDGDYFRLLDPNGSPISTTITQPAAGEVTIEFAPVSQRGEYRLIVDGRVSSVAGAPLDVDSDGQRGETLEDAFIHTLLADRRGPSVYHTSPWGSVLGSSQAATLEEVAFVFDETLNPSTVSLDDVVGFTGPDGSDLRAEITELRVAGATVTVAFPARSVLGEYMIAIGPEIEDVFGNLMDQSNDGVGGAEDDSFALSVTLQTSDLSVQSLAMTTDGTFGQPLSASWTVANLGNGSAAGVWTDYVYLSTDGEWDLDDTLIGTYQYDSDILGPVAAGNSYTGSLETTVPAVVSGDYHLIVRANLERTIAEIETSNNLSVNAVPSSLSLPQLAFGEIASGDLYSDQPLYWVLDVSPEDAGKQIVARFDFPSTVVAADLYLRKDELPNAGENDSWDGGNLKAEWAVVTDVQPGKYILGAAADFFRSTPKHLGEYSVSVAFSDLVVTDTDFGVGGTSGERTIGINGVDFDRSIQASLTDGLDFMLPAARMWYEGSEAVFATFDLSGVDPGVYSLLVQNGLGESTLVADSFEVMAGGGADLRIRVSAPAQTRFGLRYKVEIGWKNTGINDALLPLLLVSNESELFLDGGLQDGIGRYDTILGSAGMGWPPGILPPHAGGTYRYYARGLESTGSTTAFVDQIGAEQGYEFDWSEIRDDLEAAFLGSGEFERAFGALAGSVGSNTSDYARMLALNAQYLVGTLEERRAPLLAAEIGLRFASASVNPSLYGMIDYAGFDQSIDDRIVIARNIETREIFTTNSFADGSFLFDSLSPGSYKLSVGGFLLDDDASTVNVGEADRLVALSLPVVAGGELKASLRTAGPGIQQASLLLQNDAGDSFSLIEDGSTSEFYFSGLPDGVYRLQVDAPGFARSLVEGIVVDQNLVEREISLQPEGVVSGLALTELGEPLQEGRVFLKGTSLAGAEVTFSSEISNGEFAVRGVPIGDYRLTTFSDDYASLSVPEVLVEGPGEVYLGDLTHREATSITGIVLDVSELSSSAAILVEARLNGELQQTTQVNQSGTFTFLNLPAGAYELLVTGDFSGLAESQEVILSEGDAVEDVQLTVSPGGTITGVVSRGGQLLEGVRVTLYRSESLVDATQSDGAGRYRFESLPLGEYRVLVEGGGFSSAEFVQVESAEGQAEADLEVTFEATVSGTAVSPHGEAISGVEVQLRKNGAVIATDLTGDDGMYSFLLFDSGDYSLTARSTTRTFTSRDFSLTAGENVTQDIVSGGSTLTVSVADGSAPIEGGFLTLQQLLDGEYETIAVAKHDSQEYAFDGLVAGSYRVLASVNRHGRGIFDLELGESDQRTAVIQLIEGYSISGAVTAEGGDPVGGAIVTIRSVSDSSIAYRTLSGPDGLYQIEGLGPGAFDVFVAGQDAQTEVYRAVSVTDNVVLDLVLAEGQSFVSGAVLAQSGTPIVNATVVIVDALDTLVALGESDASGNFILPAYLAEESRLVVSADGYSSLELEIPAGAGEDFGALVLPPGALPASIIETQGDSAGADDGDIVAAAFTGLLPHEVVPWIFDVINSLDNYDKHPEHVEQSDIPTLPEGCDFCESRWREARKAAFILEGKYGRVEDAEELYESLAREAARVAHLEALEAAGTISGLTAALLQATTLAKLLPAAEGIAGLNIAEGVASIIAGINSASNAISNASSANNASDALASFTTFNGIMTGVFESAAGLADALGAVTTAVADQWGVFKLVNGLLGQLNNFAQYFNSESGDPFFFSRTRQLTNLMLSAERDYSNAIVVYELEVRAASRALIRYRGCLLSDRCQNPEEEKEEECEGDCDDTKTTDSLGSFDPNDILGPSTVGEGHWVNASDTLDYTIRFENDADRASAPAAVVRVTQLLDEDLDLNSFRLGEIQFGSFVISDSVGRDSFQSRLDFTETLGAYVDVTAGLDASTREAFWEIRTIDPSTGIVPFDPLLGFLPPNADGVEGQGQVSYSVLALKERPTGTVIKAVADIYFDSNPPIATNRVDPFDPNQGIDPAKEVPVVLDRGSPSSQVTLLPAKSLASFDVTWSGNDELLGSGIESYSVFVSEAGGPFQPWLIGTDLTSSRFQGKPDTVYEFVSRATDLVGNVEELPGLADATTTTVAGVAPAVTGVAVQGSQVQRSLVNSLTIVFDREMDLSALLADGSIVAYVTLTNLGTDVAAGVTELISLNSSQFTYRYDEVTGASELVWSLNALEGQEPSLADGLYRLKLAGDGFLDTNGIALDGDNDLDPGGTHSFLFHRLSGDANGDMVVDVLDMQLVNNALGARPGLSAWDPNADLDRDGRVTVRDRVIVGRSLGNQISTDPSAVAASVVILPGDFNADGVVDAADYAVWRDHLGDTNATTLQGDITGDQLVSADDYAVWRSSYGLTLDDYFASLQLTIPPGEEEGNQFTVVESAIMQQELSTTPELANRQQLQPAVGQANSLAAGEVVHDAASGAIAGETEQANLAKAAAPAVVGRLKNRQPSDRATELFALAIYKADGLREDLAHVHGRSASIGSPRVGHKLSPAPESQLLLLETDRQRAFAESGDGFFWTLRAAEDANTQAEEYDKLFGDNLELEEALEWGRL